jgi:hypothetical protein
MSIAEDDGFEAARCRMNYKSYAKADALELAADALHRLAGELERSTGATEVVDALRVAADYLCGEGGFSANASGAELDKRAAGVAARIAPSTGERR